MKTLYGKLFIFLVIIIVLQIFHYYPRLPDVVASHFDSTGKPNGWSTKNVFFGMYIAMTVLMIVSFAVLPYGLKKIPVSLISLPKKDYWLAPERREITIITIGNHMLVFGSATLLFLIAVIEMVVRTNLTDDPRLDSNTMWFLLITYFVFTSFWLVRFIRRFTNIPDKRHIVN